MNPNDDTQDKELLERFRRASGSTPAAPSDAVRAAILAEGRRIAAQLKTADDSHPFDVSKPAANDARWKITAFGTAGAAVLAALLIVPRFWESAPPVARNAIITAPSVTESAPAPPRLAAAPKPATESAQSPAPAMDSIVVTQSRQAENYQKAAPPAATRGEVAADSAVAGAAAASNANPAARLRNSPFAVTLLSAAEAGNLAQTTQLLDQGAATDAPDELGRTPLMLAIVRDQIDVARLLLSRGANPNVADKAGTTPLALAKQKNLPELVELLERAGAR